MAYIMNAYIFTTGAQLNNYNSSHILATLAINQNKLLPIQIEPHIQAIHKHIRKQKQAQTTYKCYLLDSVKDESNSRSKMYIIVSKYTCGPIIYLHKARYGVHSYIQPQILRIVRNPIEMARMVYILIWLFFWYGNNATH